MHDGIYPELAGIKVARQQVVDLISTVQEVKKVQSFTHLLTPLLHLQVQPCSNMQAAAHWHIRLFTMSH